MTAQQFYSEEGQKLNQLESQYKELLNRQGYYSKGVAKLSARIEKQKEIVEKFKPHPAELGSKSGQ